jgi:p-aminobenzoyl-glutamate transporter AbgT
MSNYEQQGRLAIISNIPQMRIMETAQANAARVLVPMIKQMGYREENITIAFRKNLTINDIIKRTINN